MIQLSTSFKKKKIHLSLYLVRAPTFFYFIFGSKIKFRVKMVNDIPFLIL